MKFLKKLSIIILLSCIIISCHNFVYKKHLIKNYYLVAVDSKYDMSVSLELTGKTGFVGRVNETVFEVGFNNRYIIAKQYPKGSKKTINYYIIDSDKDDELKEKAVSVIGPLNEVEFYFKLSELGIKNNISFSLNLENMFL